MKNIVTVLVLLVITTSCGGINVTPPKTPDPTTIDTNVKGVDSTDTTQQKTVSRQANTVTQGSNTEAVSQTTSTYASTSSPKPAIVGTNELKLQAKIDETMNPSLKTDGITTFERSTQLYFPQYLSVLKGNGADGKAVISFDKISCTYLAGAANSDVLNPYDAEGEFQGRLYQFQYCDGGFEPGNLMTTKKIVLHIETGNLNAETEVQALFNVYKIGE